MSEPVWHADFGGCGWAPTRYWAVVEAADGIVVLAVSSWWAGCLRHRRPTAPRYVEVFCNKPGRKVVSPTLGSGRAGRTARSEHALARPRLSCKRGGLE
jgi:hypothetical protein